MIDTSKGFHLIRTYDVEPVDVWDAWTNADAISQWWHGANSATPRDSVEVDARSGGRYRYTMVDDDTGERVTTGGVYRLVEFCELLEFTWGHVDGDPEEQPLVIVELEPARHGTRMSVELRGVDGVEGDGSYYDGWVSALNSLEGYLERASA